MEITGTIGNCQRSPAFNGGVTMLRLAMVLVAIDLSVPILGFSGVTAAPLGLIKVVLFAFLGLAVLSFLGSGFRRRYFW